MGSDKCDKCGKYRAICSPIYMRYRMDKAGEICRCDGDDTLLMPWKKKVKKTKKRKTPKKS